MVTVVVGILTHHRRLLLAQRPEGKDFPFTWECPGGKVEGNESHHQALRRELKEELGFEVGALPETAAIVQSLADLDILLLFFRVSAWSPIVPREGQGFGWFQASEMHALPLAPGNLRVEDALRRVAFR